MLSEVRTITFSNEELIEALAIYDQQADQKFTCGLIKSVDITYSPGMSFSVAVNMVGESQPYKIETGPAYVGAALVMFCTNHRIPIPRNAIRNLKEIGQNIALCFGMNEQIETNNGFALQHM